MSKLALLNKLHARAERHRTAAVGWKPGTIVAKSEGKPSEANLYIYQVIGMDWWTGEGVTADAVRQALDSVKGVKTLNIFINSEGGSLLEAKAIYANLARFDAEKVVYVDGIAASAASYIAMVAPRIITSAVGVWMIHEAWGGAMGNADDLRAYADVLEMMNADLAELYAKQTGKTVDECLKLMSEETWLNAAQALELGLTDEVAEAGGADAEASAQVFKPAAAAATTEKLLGDVHSELLAYRARRAGAAVAAAATKNPARASPAKSASPASR
jgi:ATP-dependent Clp protease protease subunit